MRVESGKAWALCLFLSLSSPLFAVELMDHHRAPITGGLCSKLLIQPVKRYLSGPIRGPKKSTPKLNQESGPIYPTFELIETYVGEDKGDSKAFGKKQVKYLNLDEREKYRVFISENTFVNQAGIAICPDEPCEGVMVMDHESKIYFSTQHTDREFHHSSLVSGGPVTFAGEAFFNGGNLTQVNNISGHYKPPMQAVLNLILELERFGIENFNVAAMIEIVEFMNGVPVPIYRDAPKYVSRQKMKDYLLKNKDALSLHEVRYKSVVEARSFDGE